MNSNYAAIETDTGDVRLILDASNALKQAIGVKEELDLIATGTRPIFSNLSSNSVLRKQEITSYVQDRCIVIET